MRRRDELQERAVLATQEPALLREAVVLAPQRIGGEPLPIALVGGEAVDVVDAVGERAGAFVRYEVADQVRAAAGYRLAPAARVDLEDEIARLLEAMMGLSADACADACAGARRVTPVPRDAALRQARVCYDHLAGDVGVRVFDSLLEDGRLVREGGSVRLDDRGRTFGEAFGIDVTAVEKARAPACLECLDWSERRSHLAGGFGRALLARFEALDWVRRRGGSRALEFTAGGSRGLARHFPMPG